MSDDEVQKLAIKLFQILLRKAIKDMGKVMTVLKSKYLGKMDFAKAGKILKETATRMMKYPKSYLEEITQRLKVSDVVGSTVKLTKRGKEFVGLSPFTNEKTPSFTVNDEKGFYHCFSSGEHGGIFDFLIKIEKLTFGDAVRRLGFQSRNVRI